MGDSISEKAVVDEWCSITGGSIGLENTLCESGYIYAGAPAKKIKPISETQRALLDQLPDRYVLYSDWFKNPQEL